VTKQRSPYLLVTRWSNAKIRPEKQQQM